MPVNNHQRSFRVMDKYSYSNDTTKNSITSILIFIKFSRQSKNIRLKGCIFSQNFISSLITEYFQYKFHEYY